MGGARAYGGFVPDEDNVVVERLLAAGALLLGKTNVAELGYGAVGHNPVFPTTRNPWALDRTSGGSSAGSAAAVAARMAPIALGSDGGDRFDSRGTLRHRRLQTLDGPGAALSRLSRRAVPRILGLGID